MPRDGESGAHHMSLAAGARIGAFEVVAKLGEGGMGEVYRARDTQLQRDVALKVLPDGFSGDAERMARFRREATTLASLNHPHIAQIHGFEQSGDTSALVMELVDGEDLSERIARGRIPLDEALPIARQIAEALDAAHAQAIIHRDLKPGNVKVRTDGTVKVLDFGLAKALDQDPKSSGLQDVSRSPTITTPAMTMRGVILGTAAYMSPEQAKGKTVDRRADIWAFGCVLFEMVTGCRPFQGEDVSDTLAAVLRGDPDWSLIPATVPPAVTALIKRCLERDVKRRVSDISTASFVIDELRQSPGLPATPPAPAIAASASTMWLVGIGLVVVLAVAAAGWAGLRYAGRPPAPAIVKFAIDPGGLFLLRNPLAMSPDGSTLAFSQGGQIVVRRMDDSEPRRLSTPNASTIPGLTFSPDGRWIAYYSNNERSLRKIEVSGGPSIQVCGAPLGIRGLHWSSFGIVMAVAEGILRCDPAGGVHEIIVRPRENQELGSPSVLTDGAHLLFARAEVANGAGLWDKGEIVVRSLQNGDERTIFTGGSDPRMLGDQLLFTSGGIEFAFTVDRSTYERRSDPVAVIEGVRRTQGVAHLAASDSGTVAYVRGLASAITASSLGLADRSGVATSLPIANAAFTHVRASRDGKRLAICTDDGARGIVWTYELGGSAPMQRLTLQGTNRYPIWSPDGVFIAFQSDRDNKQGIFRQRADGTGEAEQLTTSAAAEAHVPQSWSPDGRHVLYAVVKANLHTLWVLDVAARRSEQLHPGQLSSTEPIEAVFSPDGKWIAYGRTLNDDLATTDRGVFVRPFPAGAGLYQAPRQGIDFHPVWSPDGRELIFVASASSGQMAAFPITPAGGVAFGTATRFPAAVTGDRLSGQHRAFDILPDGRFVGLTVESGSAARSTEIQVIVNWLEEVKGRLARR